MQIATEPSPRHVGARTWRHAFTIMELMVSIGILILIILAVGVTFSGASNSVGTSQAVMEEMASVRATQGLMERDLQSLDKNGFLVIRSRLYSTNAATLNITYRFDQLSFLANGSFANRSGADTGSPFTDSTSSNAAHIWWGQLIMEKNSPPASYATPNQAANPPLDALPTGVVNNSGNLVLTKESDFVLGRHVSMLLPGPANGSNQVMMAGNAVMAYPSLDGTANTTIAGITEEPGFPAHITSGRYSTVAQSPAQVMQAALAARVGGNAAPEAGLFTYRFHALASVYDTEDTGANPFVNGYFRTTPQVMAGVPTFKVEWTNGNVYQGLPTDPPGSLGQLIWYGATNLNGNLPAGTEQFNAAGLPTGDQYIATFSYFNKAYWPKALRITMRVASDRLGGRDFTQIVNLPQ